ncbi:hypothetical protein [Nonomuraea sp. NPDC049709]|uniref:hypothetical protein n=1 Tax=Nonomuraea sp. NPDC049709 TaxID=3154736 RepID=UPI00343E4D44
MCCATHRWTGNGGGELAVKLGWAATRSLDSANMIDLLSGVLAQDPPPRIRGELRFLIALLLERVGAEPAALRRIYKEAVPELGDRPELAALAMVGLGVPTAPGVPLAEHVHWLDRAGPGARYHRPAR